MVQPPGVGPWIRPAWAIDRCGFEAEHTTSAEHADLAAGLAGQLELHPTAGIVEKLRAIKDGSELAAMRRAIALTDQVIQDVTAQLRPTHSEREAAWMFEKALREGGAERPSFPIIVAAGPNAAQAHHRPGEDLLGEGRPIIIDMGAHIDGCNADLTRTIILGDPDEHFWSVYDTVLAAQRLALAGLRPGMHARSAMQFGDLRLPVAPKAGLEGRRTLAGVQPSRLQDSSAHG